MARKKKIDFNDIIQIDSRLNEIQDLDILLEEILTVARSFLQADAGSIYIKEEEALHIRYSQNNTLAAELEPGEKLVYSIFAVPISEKSLAGYVALNAKVVNIPDVYKIPQDAPYSFNTSFDLVSGYKTTSMLTIPLKTSEGIVLGVIQLINAQNSAGKVQAFTSEQELLAGHFAGNATVALQRAVMTRSMLLRMTKMSELRDPKETGAHVNRVAAFSTEIYERWAFKQGLSKEEIEKFRDNLRIAAMLHDVGKVAISDVILKKPGRFTPEEYKIIQQHSLYGSQLFVDPQNDLDRICREVALTHHENWDGTGYPGWVDPASGKVLVENEDGSAKGKLGEEIPLAGRIVAIADVFDALSSKRVYKEAWDEASVFEEMRKMSNTKFDPALVDVFFEILPAIRQIQEKYPE